VRSAPPNQSLQFFVHPANPQFDVHSLPELLYIVILGFDWDSGSN
jgi:hypothetical protein